MVRQPRWQAHLDFQAQNRFDAFLAAGAIEFHGPAQAQMVGQSQGGQARLVSGLRQFCRGRQPFQEGVTGMGTQMGVQKNLSENDTGLWYNRTILYKDDYND